MWDGGSDEAEKMFTYCEDSLEDLPQTIFQSSGNMSVPTLQTEEGVSPRFIIQFQVEYIYRK